MEYQQASESAAFATIAEKVRLNTQEVLEHSRREQVPPRRAAVAMATERVRNAMSIRRWSLF